MEKEYKIIDNAEVPNKKHRGKWAVLFSEIPAGKAAVLEGKDGRDALNSLNQAHRAGKFTKIRGLTRNAIVYLMHEVK